MFNSLAKLFELLTFCFFIFKLRPLQPKKPQSIAP